MTAGGEEQLRNQVVNSLGKVLRRFERNMKKSEKKRIVLFASIEPAQHEALRYIAFKKKRSIADVTREALDRYIREESAQYPGEELKAILVEARAAEPSRVSS